MNDIDRIVELDRELVGTARDIKVLSSMTWDPAVRQEFLSAWHRGQSHLPLVTYPTIDRSAQKTRLTEIIDRATEIEHPLSSYVARTARSYLNIVCMLDHLGQPEMSALSTSIYGRPGDPLSGGKGTTSLDAAKYFLDVSSEFYRNHQIRDAERCLSSQLVAQEIESKLTEVFPHGCVNVLIDDQLTAKAAAGATRIRLRDSTQFSQYDAAQLLQHEAFVHSLTSLNGRAQAKMQSLSLGAPRTTAAQEGLATFAELVTGVIDMARLERIALRIIAIDMALGGADFIDVFKYFLDAGQPESESFNSTARVFRGAPTSGGHAFTKDSVYLHGLLEVHTFFRWALREQRLSLCEYFFAGRMTLGDVIRFEPFFADGTIDRAVYLPPWMTRTTGLGGYLAFSVFANTIDLSALYAEHKFEILDRE